MAKIVRNERMNVKYTTHEKKGKLIEYQWEFTEYYRGTVKARSEEEAVDKVDEQLRKNKLDRFDGGELTQLDEIK